MKTKSLLWGVLLVTAGFVGGLALTSSLGSHAVHTPLAAPTAIAAPSVSSDMMNAADVSAMAMPAVVNISTDKVTDMSEQHPFMNDPFFRRFFDVPNGNTERIERSLGSGVVISADGYILTNNHVIDKAQKIKVSFNNNEEHEAKLIGADPQSDIAVVKIDAKDLPFIKFGNSDEVRVGDTVLAIGNPFGVGQTVTKGICSAKGRSIGLIDYEDLIQTDATINPGNSGGALVNMHGELVGMNTAILSRSGGSQGIGFAVPSNMAKHISELLRDKGEVQRAWLGVNVQDVNQAMSDYYGLDRPRGVVVSKVNDDTPAAKAGMKEGDVILSVDGKNVANVSQLRNRISLLPVDKAVDLSILRDGKEKTLSVKLAAMPSQEELASNSPTLNSGDDESGIDGVSVHALTDDMRMRSQLPHDVDGVLVLDVKQSSNAGDAGLARGDVIVSVNNKPVTSIEDYRNAVNSDKDKPLLVRVFRMTRNGGGQVFIAIPR